MHRVLLILFLTFSSFVFAQHEPSPATDLDWEAEMNLFNRFYTGDDPQGAYAHAEKMLEIANRKKLGAREVGASEWAIGEALRKMEKFSEAEPRLRQSLKSRESVLPPTHYRVLQSVDALANILYLEGKYDEAAPLTERAIAGYAAMTDRDGPDECHYGLALQNLGTMEMAKKNADKAEGLLIRAANSFANVSLGCGQLHGVYWSLASVYWLENRKDKVEEVYQAAVKVFAPEAGEDADYHYGYYLMCLAGVYTSEKRFDEADALFKRAIQAATHVSTSEGPETNAELLTAVLREYRYMLVAANRTADIAAVDQQLQASAAATAADAKHPEMQLEVLRDEALRAEQDRRFDDAEKSLRREVEVARSLGPGDGRAVLAEVDLAYFLERMKRPDEALRTAEQAFNEAKRGFSDDPNVFGRACDAMAFLYDARHNDPALESMLKLSVKIWEPYPNKADFHYPRALTALGRFYLTRKQYTKAEPLFLESLKLVERTQGADNFSIVSAVESLGYLYAQMGAYDKAEPYYRRDLALWEKRFGTNSPMLNGVLYTLAEVMRNLGRPKEADEFMARRERLTTPATQK